MFIYVFMGVCINILRFMHEHVFVCKRMFVFMLVTVFNVTFCAHILSSDSNLACFCPVYILLPQERRHRLGDLPIHMDCHMAFRASSMDRISFVYGCAMSM